MIYICLIISIQFNCAIIALHSQHPNIGIVLLAAGSSSRLGKPKQLLDIQGKTMLQSIIDIAIDTHANNIVLILGVNHAKIEEQIDTKNITTAINLDYEEGLASSIRLGLKRVQALDPNLDAVILSVCDQPFLTTKILNQIIVAATETSQPIIHCKYEESSGPPTLFRSSLFPLLMELKGAQGGKTIIEQMPKEVHYIDFPAGKWDIDTENDYKTVLQMMPTS